ncbi:MAG TPA: DUF1761 family protein [Candidatus Binatia bacterium]|nr:DUF1761 family protein [Candidatus Binatia bacterium]
MTLLLLSLAGAAISVVVGTVWYANATPMGKLHMRYLGMDKLSPEQQKAKMKEGAAMMPKMFAAQLALSFLTAGATAFIITESVHNGLSFWMGLGFVFFNWLCFMVPMIGQGILWGTCDRKIAWQKFFSDSASNLVTLLLISFLTKLFL